MYEKLIKEAFEAKKIFGFRTKHIDWGEIILGYIENIADSQITINEIDEYGCPIGHTIVEISDILHIEMGGKYQETIETLYRKEVDFNENARHTAWLPLPKLLSYFKLIRKEQKIARFFLNEDDYVTGRIIDIDSTHLLIEDITANGEADGISCYPLNCFIGVRYDGIEEQKIELLLKNIKQSS